MQLGQTVRYSWGAALVGECLTHSVLSFWVHSIAYHLCDQSTLRLLSLLITQWSLLNIPPSPLYLLSKVKHFFLAIYNVSVVGGAMYFFSLFESEKPDVCMLLRCIGLFISATLPVLIIIFPKFTVIQFKTYFRKNFHMGSSHNSDESLSNVSKAPVASLFNFRSQSMKVLPDAYTPEFNNSSFDCNTPSGHLLVDKDTPPKGSSTSPPRF